MLFRRNPLPHRIDTGHAEVFEVRVWRAASQEGTALNRKQIKFEVRLDVVGLQNQMVVEFPSHHRDLGVGFFIGLGITETVENRLTRNQLKSYFIALRGGGLSGCQETD